MKALRLCVDLWLLLLGMSLHHAQGKVGVHVLKGLSPRELPNPMKNPAACGRPNIPRSQICDPDEMLSKESKDVVEGYINAITKAEVAVAIVNSMAPAFIGVDDVDTATRRFSMQLHNTWGVGDASIQNGILVFLSIGDRSIFISRGDGVAKALNMDAIESIINHMKTPLRSRKYGSAVELCITEIDLVLSGRSSEIAAAYTPSFTDKYGDYIFLGGFFAIAGFIGLKAYWQSQKLRRLQQGTEAMKKLMKDIEGMNSDEYFESKTCPICLDDFPVKPTEIVQGAATVVDGENVNNVEMAYTGMERTRSETVIPAAVIYPGGEEEGLLSSDNQGGIEASTISNTNLTMPRSASPGRPMALRCGHIFCYSCLESHLKSPEGTKCPICRQPVDVNARPYQPPRPDRPWRPQRNSGSDNDIAQDNYSNPSCSSSSSFYTGSSFSRHRNTIDYRVRRMHHLYPDYMTIEMMRSMQRSLNTDNPIAEFNRLANQRQTEAQTMITDIKARQKAARSGSGGASRGSFGGGSSGGGGGGRW